jgi:D-alanyl-lipoteichoic acid acyltransferase DltB (MBOAT superfamily)
MRNGDFWRKHPILVSNIAILVTFIICGVWHGETFNFVLWGLYQGVGIATVNTYQSWKRKVRHNLARKYFTSPWSHGLGTVMTFAFFALGQSLFVLDANQARALLGRLAGM